MRRLVISVVAAVALVVLGGTTAAYALWQVNRPVSDVVVTTGNLDVQATWAAGSTPSFGPLFPGSTTNPSTLEVTATGTGDALRWRLTVQPTQPLPIGVTMTAVVCGTSTTVLSAYPATGSLAPGATVNVCIRYGVSSTAPRELQSTQLHPALTVTALQVRP